MAICVFWRDNPRGEQQQVFGNKENFYSFLNESAKPGSFDWKKVDSWFQRIGKDYPIWSCWVSEAEIEPLWKNVWNLYVDKAFENKPMEKIQLVALNIRRLLLNKKNQFLEEKKERVKQQFLSMEKVEGSPFLDSFFFDMFTSKGEHKKAFSILTDSGYSQEELNPHATYVMKNSLLTGHMPKDLLDMFPHLEKKLRENILCNIWLTYHKEGAGAALKLLPEVERYIPDHLRSFRGYQKLLTTINASSARLNPAEVNLFCFS